MIEINDSIEQTIYIPRNGNGTGTEYVLVVTSTIDNIPITVPVSSVVVDGRYYRMTLAQANIPHSGEWRYTFSVDGEEVSNGLLKVNTGEVEMDAYNEGNIREYKEYEC